MTLGASIRDKLAPRIIILGNSGSGKSILAAALGAKLDIPIIHLDSIHWEDGGSAQKRNEDVARDMVVRAAAADAWIMEGVYGWLCSVALPRAVALLWLDLPWEECRAGLLARKGQAIDSEMLLWAEEYSTRQTSSSFTGHQLLYEDFAGFKIQLRSRQSINDMLALI